MILGYPTWQVKRFVASYVVDYDGNRAALEADIDPTDLTELLTEQEVVNLISDNSLRSVGRPSMEFDQTVADLFLERVAMGATMQTITSMDDMPSRTVIYKWLRSNETFNADYARAKDDAADSDFEMIGYIAHQVRTGKLDPKAGRAAADIMKWKIGKQRPKKYGDILRTEMTGKDGGAIETKDTTPVNEKELARRLAFILQKGAKSNESA